MSLTGHIIRWVASVALLTMVWREAGVFTSAAITGLMLSNEFTGAVLNWHGEQIRGKESPNG